AVVAFAAVTTGAFACGGAASDVSAPGSAAAVTIAITPSAAAVAIGSQVALQAQVQDASGQPVPGATIFWSSSDTSVATVSSAGVVTGRTVGSAQIAASSAGESAVRAIAVVQVPVASLAVLPSSVSLAPGASTPLQAVTYDAAGNTLPGRSVVWATSAPQVVSVAASGVITALTAGSASITATSEGKTASAAITVTVVPVASVTVTPGSAALTVGQSAALSAAATDANGNVLSGRSVTWSSANSSVATVSGLGMVSATGAGSTTVTATSEGKSGIAQVVVTAPPVTPPVSPPAAVARVRVTPSSVSLHTGGSSTITAQVLDAGDHTITGCSITWRSNNSKVSVTAATATTALVRVVGNGNGTASVSATCQGIVGIATVTFGR
ncbi:MAG: Ig-like domain-containing protein, partial [Gemmatimonadaceae bacterium]